MHAPNPEAPLLIEPSLDMVNIIRMTLGLAVRPYSCRRNICCCALASLALGVMVFQRSAARAGLLLVCITAAAVLRPGSAAQHNSAFCSEDMSQTGLSSACSSAQSDKNLDLKDECFSGHCKTGQYDQACSTAGFNFLVPTSRRHYQQGY